MPSDDPRRFSIVLGGGVGFCNAVRRSVIGDVASWAPHEVLVEENSSVETDEFIAHRLGLIPFRKEGEGDSITLSGEGPCFLTVGAAVGHAFRPVYPSIEVMQLGKGQRVSLTIRFDRKTGSTHARYSPVAAVGMEKVDGEGRCKLSFESTNGTSPRDILMEALSSLEARVDGALHALANQPKEPPQSMC